MRAHARPRHKLDVPAHPRFKGFEEFAAREIFPWLAEQEAQRQRVVRQAFWAGAATVVIVGALLVFAFSYLKINIVWVIILFGVVPAILGAAAVGWLLIGFHSTLKEYLLGKACAQLGLRYTGKNANLPFDRFVEARLLPGHSSHNLEDGIESADTPETLSAAEATLSKRGSDDDETVWRGLLVALPAPRRFEGRTLVMPKRGAIEKLFDKRASEAVALGLGELEDGLEIRSTHPDEARGVLTERVMRRLAELAGRLGHERPSLALFEEDVLLAIESDTNRFEGGSIFEPLDQAARVNALIAEFALLFELADAIGDAFRDALRGRPGRPV